MTESATRSQGAAYALEMRGIDKSFNGVKVLDQARLRVRSGEAHALLGENGAGKSTLVKILAGAYRREGGEIRIDGRPSHYQSPREALAAGISVIYQEFSLAAYLPVYENIFLGKEYGTRLWVDKKQAIREAAGYLRMLGMELPPETLVCELSVAQKQLVEIAKAISNHVRILVLDEPTAAITDKETRLLFAIIRDLKRRGLGIVYISHRLPELFEIADRCTVMRDGAFVGEVDMKDVDEGRLTRMMVGRDIDAGKSRRRSTSRAEPVLEVRNLGYRDKLRDINLTLRQGEILGLAGLVGAGRTELARCLIGDCRPGTGEVVFQGRRLAGGVPESVERGIAYLGEDRKDAGLALDHAVADNIALPSLGKFGRGILNHRRMLEACRGYIRDLHIRPNDHRAAARNLSGGNQQKVVIAKWLCFQAKVYIFDEPTRGIDVGARDDIYRIMERLVDEGASILLISSDMAELMKMSDRIAVMNRGRIVAVLENDDRLTREAILSHAVLDREKEPAKEAVNV